MRRAHLAAAIALGLAVAASPDARANGRFPMSNAIFFAPSDHQTVLLRTTFGEMLSHDRGKTWDWICEQSVGLAGVEDPMFSFTTNGTLLSSTFQGLSLSHDKGCNFGYVGGALKDLVFIDLASRPSTPDSVVAFASSYAGQDEAGALFYTSSLFETTDQGGSFAALPAMIDPSLLGETVDVTPSDPDRIYVSAVRDLGTPTPGAVLLTSKDHGKTFTEAPVPMVGSERAVFIAAVDPLVADRLYVRTSAPAGDPSRLLVSDDAGKTFRTIFSATGQLLGFALSPDGTKVWTGGPLDGLQMASTTDFAFKKKSKVEVQCLKLADDGLWACSTEKTGFVVGLSTDEGATFATRLHFCDIRGPLTCPSGSTTQLQCSLGGTSPMATPPWPAQLASLGCTPGQGDGGSTDSGPGVDAGPQPAAQGMDGGGGCSLRAPSATPLAALLAAIASSVALVRRRRRRP